MFAGGFQRSPSTQLEEPLSPSLKEDFPDFPDEGPVIFGPGPAVVLGTVADAAPLLADDRAGDSRANASGKMFANAKSKKGSHAAKDKKAADKRSSQKPDEHSTPVEGLAEDAGYGSSSAPVAAEQPEQTELSAADEASRKLLATSWAELREHEKNGGHTTQAKKEESDSQDRNSTEGAVGAAKESQKEAPKSRFRFWGGGAEKGEKEQASEGAASSSQQKKGNTVNGQAFEVPNTFAEMCQLNATMIGANLSFIKLVQECFEGLVSATVKGDEGRLELESNLITLRLNKDVVGDFRLSDFKTCMLASLRSLLPESWSIAHEQAWIGMWEAVEKIVMSSMALPKKYEKAVHKLVSDMGEEEQKKFGLKAFNRLFDAHPKTEDYFITSNSRLSVLMSIALKMSNDMYREPTRMVNETTSLGLRHIMYNIPTVFFEPFVSAIVEELKTISTDALAIEGVEWSLTQIACIMVYTIDEGSNPLLRAVIANSKKDVKAALSGVARKDRAEVCL